jgi:predicted choloylglycine hydrolase
MGNFWVRKVYKKIRGLKLMFLWLRIIGLVSLLLVTWSTLVFHLSVLTPPQSEEVRQKATPTSIWIDKSQFGMHQVILSGNPRERGLAYGRHTQSLLYQQEKALTEKLKEFIPSQWLLKVLDVLTIRWFWGLDSYFEPWMLQEMDGVSQSASHEFDYLADRFTRQIAYHGLHEVSQMTIDQGMDAMGCTVAAIPFEKSWIIGRNFDFEGGRIFDSEKVLKWVFPDQGYAYVSVIWAGMVGALTGVNENGIYISLNAAGSNDFRRYGMPSTLVLLKALQFSKSADDAIQILRNEIMFITDIFVVLDSKAGRLYRVEKSPQSTEVIPLSKPAIVTNHLIGKTWENDPINLYRKKELTSEMRAARGESLLKSLPKRSIKSTVEGERFILSLLRDKGEMNGKPLYFGNRRAIDPLIAAHSVVYNAVDEILFVSQGPGISGGFSGFDLRASFKSRKPEFVRELPKDPLVSEQLFQNVHFAAVEISQAEQAIKKGQCKTGREKLDQAALHYQESSGYYTVLGDYYQCKQDLNAARSAWKKALSLYPPYLRQIHYLEEKIKQ